MSSDSNQDHRGSAIPWGVHLEHHQSIAIAEFNDVSMTTRFTGWLVEVMDYLDTNPSCRAVVLTGTRTVFMSGADFTEVKHLHTVEQVEAFLRTPHALMRRIEESSLITVAAINGYCLGGGLELAAICDYRIAPADAGNAGSREAEIFGFPEARLGLVPALGGIYSLHRLSPTSAFSLLASGRSITSADALRIGLVDEVVPQVQVVNRAIDFCKDLLKNPDCSLHAIKRLSRTSNMQTFAEALAQAGREFAQCCLAPDKDKRLIAAKASMTAAFRRNITGPVRG